MRVAESRLGEGSWLIPIKANLFGERALLTDPREFVPKIFHIVAQFHYRDNTLDLIMDFLTSRVLENMNGDFVGSEGRVISPDFFPTSPPTES